MSNVQKGSRFRVVLTVMENGAVKNISTSTNRKIVIEKPNNSVIEKTGGSVTLESNGADGKIGAWIEQNENDVYGLWQAQVDFTLGEFAGRTTIFSFPVDKNVGE